MPAVNPEKIKVVKQLARPDIVFAVARKPDSGPLYCGGSDFAVYEIDIDQPKPQAREFGRHDSYVTSLALAGSSLISGGYDGCLIWWNVESRSQVRKVDCPRQVDPRCRRHARWGRGRQRRRRHGLPALGRRERPDDPRAFRPRRS